MLRKIGLGCFGAVAAAAPAHAHVVGDPAHDGGHGLTVALLLGLAVCAVVAIHAMRGRR